MVNKGIHLSLFYGRQGSNTKPSRVRNLSHRLSHETSQMYLRVLPNMWFSSC